MTGIGIYLAFDFDGFNSVRDDEWQYNINN